MSRPFGGVLICVVLSSITIHAAVAEQSIARSAEGVFDAGRHELGVGAGLLFSPFIATQNRPTVSYALSEVQYGCMLSDLSGTGWGRRNWELVGDVFAGGIFDGRGDYVCGGTAWLRCNIVPPETRIAPFVQAGAGLALTDADRRVIGQEFNFNLNVGIGVRYLVSHDWSINIEYRYQHLSNANLARRNVGINAHGPFLAVSRFF